MRTPSFVGALLLSSCVAPAALPPGPRTSDVTELRWTDDHGASVKLATWRGTPLVVTMIYRTCQVRCPMTLGTMRRLETSFARAHQPVALVLVTLDPQNDTPERLAGYKKTQNLDDAWHLLNGDEATTKELGGVLRVHAAKDDAHVDHDVRVGVWDARGTFVRAFEGWDFPEADVLAAARR